MIAKRQSPIELEHVRRRFDPRLHELIQRLIKKVMENTQIIQELVIDPVSGDPAVDPELVQIAVATVALAPSAFGNFTVVHGLGFMPIAVVIEMTSAGLIWFQATKYDTEKLYLVSSEAGLTADAQIFY